MYNDPEWATTEEWDAYAWFGFAISEAQAVERLLLIIAVAIKAAESQPQHSEDPWFSLYDKLGRLALGPLLKQVPFYQVLDDDILKMLTDAVEKRNDLAHEFFLPRGTLMDPFERPPTVAKKELQQAASLFSHLSTRLESIIWPLLERLDIPRDAVERETDRVLRADDSPSTV
ncbi:MAG: hypothetical protein ACXW18_08730 [Pyrinomonadaceae bacterium]